MNFESPYLERKGVQGHGVRYGPGAVLLVPMRDAAGELWNVQTIKPEKPTDGAPEKLFLKGGRKSGLWHWVGNPEGAPALLIAEGLATASSVHEATGRPVAVAFDAGNLAPVAKGIHKAHPAALIVLCADNDIDTEAKTGTNPGRIKASEAARAVRGVTVWPSAETLPPGASDFNDLHKHAGLDPVRDLIESTIKAGPPSARAKPTRPTPSPDEENAAAGASDEGATLPHGYSIRDGWLWYAEGGTKDQGGADVKVCTALAVTAQTRDGDGDGWGMLLSFEDPSGKRRKWPMPARMLAGDGTEYRAALLGLGLRIAPGKKARDLLTLYLQLCRPPEIAQCTDRTGWHHHGRAFVLPRTTVQSTPAEGEDAPEQLVYQTDAVSENPFSLRGSLDGWRTEVAALCIGNSRLTLAACGPFAGTLLRCSGLDSGGLHLRGDSQTGKSTCGYVAASVFGSRDFMQRWRATSNALESVAALYCDTFLVLDDIGQIDPREAGEVAYLLGNEAGKARSTRTGGSRPRQKWKLLFLSTGEVSLATHAAEGGKKTRAGQETRMADVPAEVIPGSVFETTHGFEGGAAFSLHIKAVTSKHHGHAGLEFIRYAVEHADTLPDRVRSGVAELVRQWVNEAAAGQVQTIGARFALHAVAGELATERGLTGWPKGWATDAVRQCFEAWLNARVGGLGNAEEAQMLTQARRWFQMNHARFLMTTRALDDHAAKPGIQAGFMRFVSPDGKAVNTDSDHMSEYGEKILPRDADGTDIEYLMFPEVFDDEVCKGFEPPGMKRLLRDLGHLKPDKGRPFDSKQRLPGFGGKKMKCYRFASSIRAEAES